MRRVLLSLSVVGLVTGLFAPSSSYAQQSVNVFMGGFVPRGADSRDVDDVLIADLSDFPYNLAFEVNDFNGFTFGAEWLVGLGRYFEAGLGAGFYSNTVPSVYANRINANGAEIEQDLRLRIAPFTATVRFLPTGSDAAIQPYIGAGVGIFAWEYSEAGEFVDPFDETIYFDQFVDNGAAVGPVIFGGVRFPIGAGAVGGEVRYQDADGELDRDDFLGTKIDLGGFSYLATFSFRF